MHDKDWGEGNKKAARRYNNKAEQFTEEHDTEQLAREAEPDDDKERRQNLKAREKAAARGRD